METGRIPRAGAPSSLAAGRELRPKRGCTFYKLGPSTSLINEPIWVQMALRKTHFWSSLVAWWVKDSALSLLWLGSSPWLWNFQILWTLPKKRNLVFLMTKAVYAHS